jgi:hypothetical protein
VVSAGTGIFDKPPISVAAMRTVSERRYGDAVALRNTKSNERANGAMYMAGFVIECLLKSHLLIEHPWLLHRRQHQLTSDDERRIWSLCFRSHDLDEIYVNLPNLLQKLGNSYVWKGPGPLILLRQVSATWTIFARYSTKSANIAEASEFIDKVYELKRYL